VNFEILEKEKECGGLVRSLQKDGFTFDYGGSHIIFSKDEEVLNFMLNLLGNNKIKKRRNTKILYKGYYVQYPFENGLADLPKEDNFECLYYFIQNLILKEKGELKIPSNFKEWLPIHELIRSLNAPKEVKEAVDNLKYNSLITVMIGLDKPKINDFTWLYIPDKDVLTHRVSFPSNYSPFVSPEGKSSVLAEITCNTKDEV